MTDPLVELLERQVRVLGVVIEHDVFANEGSLAGTYAFAVDVDGEWTEFSPYPSIEAVKTALLKLQNGANPWTV